MSHSLCPTFPRLKKRLGFFSTDPTTFIKEFEYLTQFYDLSWHNIYVLLLLSNPKGEVVCLASSSGPCRWPPYAMANPDGAHLVPRTNPRWDYQVNSPGHRLCSHMITHLIAGLKKPSPKVVNDDKLNKITQSPKENLALLLSHLMKVRPYRNLPP